MNQGNTARPSGTPAPTTLLVVEDERTIAEAITARLEAEGFAVDQVHDGLAAL